MNFIQPYLKAWPIIIAGALTAYFFANKYLKYAVPQYESTAKIRLADANEGVPGNNLYKDMDVFASGTKIMAEIEVMKSRVILEKVLAKTSEGYVLYRKGKLKMTELYMDSPIHISFSGDVSALTQLPIPILVMDTTTYKVTLPSDEVIEGKIDQSIDLGKARMIISINQSAIEKNVRIADQYVLEIKNKENVIADLQSKLDITSVDKDVPVVRISFKSSNPAKAAAIVNTIAETYIEDYIKVKYEAADLTSDFLKTQISDISSRLSQSENKIQSYRDKNNIINVRQETETDLRKISQLKIQQTNLKMNLEAIQDLNTYITTGKNNFLDLAPNFEAFTDLLSTEMMKKIKELQATKKDLLLTYTPADDRVKIVDRKIKDYTDYLVESIQNTKNNLETKYNHLNQDIEEAEKVFIGLPEREKLLTIMNREFDLYQSSYMFLNNKKIEADIAKAAKNAFHRILNPAVIASKPVAPNHTIIKLVSILLGIFGGISLIALKELFYPGVKNIESIETKSAIPVGYTTASLKNSKDHQDFFRKTAISLQLKEIILPGKVTAFSSMTSREGRSFHVKNLALSLADQGNKVLIVDVNGDFITGDTSNTSIYIASAFNKDEKRMNTKEIGIMMDKWRQQYDHILINNEDLANATFAPLFLNIAHTNFFVLDSKVSSSEDITKISLLADEYKVCKPHFVLNRFQYNPGIFKLLSGFIRSFSKAPKQAVTI